MAKPKDVLSRSEQRKLVKIARRVFAEEFPNPDRIGCPSSEVLKAMALRRPVAAGRVYPIDHLTICSPCFRQYSRYRAQAQMRKGMRFALIAAAVLLVFGPLVWIYTERYGWPSFQHDQETAAQSSVPFQPVTLDLRPFAPRRAERPPDTDSPPLVIPRGRVRLSILLPAGSEEGEYEIGLLAGNGRKTSLGRARTRIVDSATALQIDADLRKLKQGGYSFTLLIPGLPLQLYSVRLD